MSRFEAIDKVKLVQNGLLNYWDANYAMRVFKDTIAETAEEVFKAGLESLGEVLGVGNSLETRQVWRETYGESDLYRVAIGVGYPWEAGIRLGIGWRPTDKGENTQPVAILTFRLSSQYKKDFLFRSLKQSSLSIPNSNTFVTESREVPREVAVWSTLSSDTDVAQVRSSLNDIFNTTIEWSKKAGPLNRILKPT